MVADGNLFDTSHDGWHKREPLRANYAKQHRVICTVADLKATLRAGEYAWPGGYQMFLITNCGLAVSFDAVKQSPRQEFERVKSGACDRIIGCAINYEDTDLYCDISGQRIPAAYGYDD